MERENKFIILVTSYNDEDWVEYNLASILNQTYSNYKVMYYNDASEDNTYQKVLNIVEDNPKFTLHNRSENKGALHSYLECLDTLEDEDILVCLSGDDWLFNDEVLENLNNFYNEKDVWMTYGKFYCWDGSDNISEGNPQNTPYTNFTHHSKSYQKDIWRASHLRTFKGFLIKKLPNSTYNSKSNNQYFNHAADLAISFPCLEMCGVDKIGVVDFPTYVYNTTPSNQQRTKNRESDLNNIKYENEIRNRKIYETLTSKTSSPKKLPQVNVFGAGVETCSSPTKFSYCLNQKDGDFDIVLLNDGEIIEYLEGRIQIDKNIPIVARLHEQRDYFQKNLMNTVLNNHNKFHSILTFDKIILENIPNARFCNSEGITQFQVCPNNIGGTPYHSSLYKDYDVNQTIKLYPKSIYGKASCITSTKSFLPGHSTRLDFVKNIKDKVELYGRGIKEIPSKLDAMHNYAFSVAIENNISSDDYYFTEKLIECFVTGTIPIYYGCPNIDKFFDIRGVLTFTTQEELDNILDNLSEEKYNSMFKYVTHNFNKCIKTMVLHNDSLYDLHLKHIINGTTI